MSKRKPFIVLICVTATALLLGSGAFIVFGEVIAGTGDGVEKSDNMVRVPILMYHHFADSGDPDTIISGESFERHLTALRDAGYTTVTFDQLISFVDNGIILPERPILITMDDGYMSNYDIAFPILKQHGMKATFFIVGVLHGKDLYKGGNPIMPRFGDAEAKEMVESGLISIQSHSYDMHQYKPYETGISRTGVRRRIDESREDYIAAFNEDFRLASEQIESITGEPVLVYSYPFGIRNKTTDKILKESGVRSTVTIGKGTNKLVTGDPESLYNLKRFNIPGDMTAPELLKMIR